MSNSSWSFALCVLPFLTVTRLYDRMLYPLQQSRPRGLGAWRNGTVHDGNASPHRPGQLQRWRSRLFGGLLFPLMALLPTQGFPEQYCLPGPNGSTVCATPVPCSQLPGGCARPGPRPPSPQPRFNPQPRGPSPEQIERDRENAQYDQTWSAAGDALNNKNYALALQLYQAANQKRPGPHSKANIDLVLGLMAWDHAHAAQTQDASDWRSVPTYFQDRQKYLEQFEDSDPYKAKMLQENQEYIDTLNKVIADFDQAAQDARDRAAADQQAAVEVVSFRTELNQKVATVQSRESATIAAVDARVQAYMAGGVQNSPAIKKPALVASTPTSGTFGTTTNPSNPDLGGSAPPAQPVGTALQQAAGAANSSRSATIANTQEDAKRLADCQIGNVGCLPPASLPVVATPSAERVLPPEVSAKVANDPEYKRFTADREDAKKTVTETQQQLDQLVAQQQSESEKTKRDEIQIRIAAETQKLESAKSQIATDDIKRDDRKKKIIEDFQVVKAPTSGSSPALDAARPRGN